MPAAVGLPRNHSAEPGNAGRAVIIGIHDEVASLAVTTRPCAVSGSALMTWMLTRAPAFTTMAGLTIPATRKISSGPPRGLATMVSRTLLPEKVIVCRARLTVAPAGAWLASRGAPAGAPPGPGAPANSAPLILPGSPGVAIMRPGGALPRIQAGGVVPPIIQR